MNGIVRRAVLALNRAAGIPAPPQTSIYGPVTDYLDYIVRDDFPRLLVDVGAYDGTSFSNSRRFTLDGWQAILVEPHPHQFATLQRLYAGSDKVTCVQGACSDEPGQFPLYLGADGPESMMSTLCTDDNSWFKGTRSDESVTVEVETLTQLLTRLECPSDFSLLLVDAEGMDYQVLRGLDFTKFRPRIIVTEEYIVNPERHRAKYRLLLDNGYTFCTMLACNTIWTANERVMECLRI